jgi:glycosyltransferase involved in cell wall biosynthesis
MTTALPFISVIMPAYNAERFLEEAVASVRRQDYRNLEVIVIDDGSTDRTGEIAKSLGSPVRYLLQAHRGPAVARNRGIREARGDVIAFLDADDLWPDGKLALQIARLRDAPDVDVILGRIQYRGIDGTEVPDIPFEGPDRTVTHVHLGSGVFRRSVFDRVGLFDESLSYSEDLDWSLRVRECGISMLILKEITLLYRLHGGNMTITKTTPDLQVLQVLKKSLDRRRLQTNGEARDLKRWSEFDEARRVDAQEGPQRNG